MFKNSTFFIVFSSFYILSFAQNSGIAVELHYPITMAAEKNNYSEVTGIFGGTVQFQFSDNELINYGIEYKFDINQTYEMFLGGTSEPINFMMNHINGFAKTNLDLMHKLKLYTDAGFSFYKYKNTGLTKGFTGFNVGAGLNYEFIDNFYAQVMYNYIKAGQKEQQTGFVDGENFDVIRISVGFKL